MQQFEDFTDVCGWLLSLLMSGQPWSADSMQPVLVNARSLLAVLTERCGLSPAAAATLTPQALSKGHGHACCVVLNWLCDQALAARGLRKLPKPDHGAG